MRRPGRAIAILCALGLFCGALPAAAGSERSDAAGKRQKLIELGERLYREGISVSGQTVSAVLEGDVRVSGEQVRCASCHGRSGLGSVEGTRVVAPISGPFLAAPRTLHTRPRGPYSDVTLARAIRDGVDAGGNALDPMMPRFKLSDADTKALVAYLKSLSARPSPGVDGDEIHLATVVAPEVPAEQREAMLELLRAWFKDKSVSADAMRPRHVSTWPEFYGRWVLHVWTLSGPPSSWERQLREQYRKQPVFAVVSGIGNDEWTPVHRFCEQQELPCLLPNVDTPPRAGESSYSFYFSGGTELEAAVMARRIGDAPTAQRVLQVFRSDTPGSRGAQMLRSALGRRSRDTAIDWELDASQKVDPAELEQRLTESRADAIVLWLAPEDLAALSRGSDRLVPVPVYVSSTLLGGSLDRVDGLSLQEGFVVHPFALPVEVGPGFRRTQSWLRSHELSSSPAVRRIQDQTFFALTVLNEGLMHVKKNFLREYLIEGLDHLSGLSAFTAYYPRLSFGPGQRRLSKGCYLIPLRASAEAPSWVVP